MAQARRAQRDARPATSYRVEALAKGLAVLSAFSQFGPSMTLTEVANRTGLPLPTTFRLAATLDEAGYLERMTDGSYRPGLAALALGHASLKGSGLIEIAREPLQGLAARTGETVNLAVLNGPNVLFLIRLRNADLVVANIHVGSTLPAEYSSLGKVLLAHLEPEDRAARLQRDAFRAHGGPRAVTSLDELESQLRAVKVQGYAVQDEEVAPGLRAIAVPIANGRGEVVAAINIAVNAARCTVTSLVDDFLAPLQQTASEISYRLELD